MITAKTVQERLAKLIVENDDGTQSFYNPVMEFNRDLTITVIQQYAAERDQFIENGSGDQSSKQKKKLAEETGPIKILDALSASGLRSIRFAQEINNVEKIIANDFSESSVKNIKRNVKENELEDKIYVTCDDAKLIMMKHISPGNRFNVIDLDPYGTAAPFLDAAVQSIADGGLLMVTCTDMAVLCGNTPEAGFVKYNSIALKHSSSHEIALRILIRCIDSHANVYGRYIEPLLCVSVDYYIRVFVKVFTSPSKAKLSACKASHLLACTGCKAYDLIPLTKTTDMGLPALKFSPMVFKSKLMNPEGKCQICDSSIHMGGPVYNFPIQNEEFVEKILKKIENTPKEMRLGTHERLLGMLTVISEELHDIPLYLTQDAVLSTLRITCLKQSLFRSIFLNAGYKISGTHCNPKGFKTNAPLDFIFDIPRSMVTEKKVESLNQMGKAIMSKNVSHTIDQTYHSLSIPNSIKLNLVRYQCNHGKNWGPKSKAKGSINSNIPAKKPKLDNAIEQ